MKNDTMAQLKEHGLPVTFRSRKAIKKAEIDLLDLPYESVLAVAQYGAMRFINDKLGGSEITSEEAAIMFNKIIKQLREGWQGRQRGEGTDPTEAKALSLAKAHVKAAILQKGLLLKDVGKERIAELAQAQFDAHRDKYLDEAAKLLEAERKAKEQAAQTIDLNALGL